MGLELKACIGHVSVKYIFLMSIKAIIHASKLVWEAHDVFSMMIVIFISGLLKIEIDDLIAWREMSYLESRSVEMFPIL